MDFNADPSAYAGYDQQSFRDFYLYNNMWPIQINDRQPSPSQQQQQQQHQHHHQSSQNQHQTQQNQMTQTHQHHYSTSDSMTNPHDQFQLQQQLQQQSRQQALIAGNWTYSSQHSSPNPPHQTILQNENIQSQSFPVPQYNGLQQSPMHYGTQQHHAMDSNIQPHTTTQGSAFMPFATSSIGQSYEPLSCYHNDLQSGLAGFPVNQRYGSQQFAQQNMLSTSPPDNAFEVQSSSGSESDWQLVNYSSSLSAHSMDSFSEMPQVNAAVSNPGLTLHIRTSSDSSQENPGSAESINSFGSYEEVQVPFHSPQSESTLDFSMQANTSQSSHEVALTSPACTCSSPSSSSPLPTSPTSSSSTSRKRKDTLSKDTLSKTTKTVFKKPAPAPKKAPPNEKRVGRRRGPLRPEQRIQAGEIRKLRACLRCKFLKKTCDKGDPCAGCQPAHARLWQVPCTRIDIRDIGDFMKNWRVDYERHVTLGKSIANIKGYASQERPLFITHGYGFVFPIQAREVFVRDDDCFNVDWVESCHENPREFDQSTARLTIGMDGIPTAMLSEYLDRHIDDGFETFISQHFEGTKFLTEMLLTVYKYHLRTKLPIIRKAIKLVLAYNLTLHITMIEGITDEDGLSGKVEHEGSKHHGKTIAPVMINFQVKHALALMWRELQRDVLEELSSLYSSVYSGEKLKNWPTIFMLASMLLAVWEEIQFDSHYRSPDPEVVKKFCNDMESTPVGVIVGLFSAISQKLPAFSDWDTRKHHQLLNSDGAVCDAMCEIRDHVIKYEDYLKSRADCKFDRGDFDSLSNKFLSKLVIRSN